MKRLLSIVLGTSIIMAGCAQATEVTTLPSDNKDVTEVTMPAEDKNDENTSELVETVKEIDYYTVGEIIQIEDNTVHILTGDVAEIFEVSQETLKDFYLGEIAGIVKEGEENKLTKYKVQDFSVRFTGMGLMIESITGEIIEATDEKLVLKTEEGEMTFTVNEKVFYELGNRVTVDYMSREDNYLMAVYDETNKLTTEVISIERAEDGSFILNLGENGEVAYVANVSRAVVNFNYSDIKPGDKLDVYFDIMLTSYPAQIGPKKVTLIK